MTEYEIVVYALRIVAVVCAALAVVMLPVVLRSKRRLDQRIRDHRREIAERQGPPPDPWQEFAQLYAAEDRSRGRARRARRVR